MAKKYSERIENMDSKDREELDARIREYAAKNNWQKTLAKFKPSPIQLRAILAGKDASKAKARKKTKAELEAAAEKKAKKAAKKSTKKKAKKKAKKAAKKATKKAAKKAKKATKKRAKAQAAPKKKKPGRPKGSRNKYEYSKVAGVIKLDRVIYSSMHYPSDYGLIPQTYVNTKAIANRQVLASM